MNHQETVKRISEIKGVMMELYTKYSRDKSASKVSHQDDENYKSFINNLKNELLSLEMSIMSDSQKNDLLEKQRRLSEVKSLKNKLTETFYSDIGSRTNAEIELYFKNYTVYQKEEEELEYFLMTDIERIQLQKAKDSFQRKQ